MIESVPLNNSLKESHGAGRQQLKNRMKRGNSDVPLFQYSYRFYKVSIIARMITDFVQLFVPFGDFLTNNDISCTASNVSFKHFTWYRNLWQLNLRHDRNSVYTTFFHLTIWTELRLLSLRLHRWDAIITLTSSVFSSKIHS